MRKPTAKQLQAIYDDVENVLDQPGPYTHNLLSAMLRVIAQKHGYGVADQVIERFELDAAFGIMQEIPKQVGKAFSGEV